MHQYYVRVLTTGAVATLREFAEEQVIYLESCAHFVKQTHERLVNRVISEIKKEWISPNKGSMFSNGTFDSLPDYVMPVFTIEPMEVEEFVTVDGVVEPILPWQKGYAAASMIDEVINYWDEIEEEQETT